MGWKIVTDNNFKSIDHFSHNDVVKDMDGVQFLVKDVLDGSNVIRVLVNLDMLDVVRGGGLSYCKIGRLLSWVTVEADDIPF